MFTFISLCVAAAWAAIVVQRRRAYRRACERRVAEMVRAPMGQGYVRRFGRRGEG